jgi:hypothetical protein
LSKDQATPPLGELLVDDLQNGSARTKMIEAADANAVGGELDRAVKCRVLLAGPRCSGESDARGVLHGAQRFGVRHGVDGDDLGHGCSQLWI